MNEVKGGFASVEEAQGYQWSDAEREQVRKFQPISGSPERVRAELAALAAELGADELMITTTVGDHALRRRSYTLLADAWGLAQTDDTSAGLRSSVRGR